jgi:Trypsin-co-occurring domain 1
MEGVVEFRLEQGGYVLVEGASLGAMPGTRGVIDSIKEQAEETFETAIARVRPVAQSVIEQLRQLAQPPQEVTVEFGLQLSGQAGVIITSTEASSHFRIALVWRKP